MRGLDLKAQNKSSKERSKEISLPSTPRSTPILKWLNDLSIPLVTSIMSGVILQAIHTAPVDENIVVLHELNHDSKGELITEIVPYPIYTHPLEPKEEEPLTLDELKDLAIDVYARQGMDRFSEWLQDQVTAESSWNPDARSPVGAEGLAQIMPSTYDVDLAPYTEPSCETIPRTNPRCSTEGQAIYMARLLRRYNGNIELATAAYNAGMGHVDKEIKRCERAMGCDPTKYVGHVGDQCSRPHWACQESNNYVRKISTENRKRVQRNFTLSASPTEGVKAGFSLSW